MDQLYKHTNEVRFNFLPPCQKGTIYYQVCVM